MKSNLILQIFVNELLIVFGQNRKTRINPWSLETYWCFVRFSYLNFDRCYHWFQFQATKPSTRKLNFIFISIGSDLSKNETDSPKWKGHIRTIKAPHDGNNPKVVVFILNHFMSTKCVHNQIRAEFQTCISASPKWLGASIQFWKTVEAGHVILNHL